MKSIAIVSEDKVGLLADISYILAKSKINIDSINVAVLADKAVISMEVSNPQKGKEVLEAAGYQVESNTIVVKLGHQQVQELAAKLAKEGVTVQRTNTLMKDEKFAVVSLSVDKPKRASAVLQPHLITNEANY